MHEQIKCLWGCIRGGCKYAINAHTYSAVGNIPNPWLSAVASARLFLCCIFTYSRDSRNDKPYGNTIVFCLGPPLIWWNISHTPTNPFLLSYNFSKEGKLFRQGPTSSIFLKQGESYLNYFIYNYTVYQTWNVHYELMTCFQPSPLKHGICIWLCSIRSHAPYSIIYAIYSQLCTVSKWSKWADYLY